MQSTQLQRSVPSNGSVYRSPVSQRRCVVSVRAQASATEIRTQPPWSGNTALSAFVNWMIATPPIFATMTFFARQLIKKSAESRGLKWDEHVRNMQTDPELHTLKQQLERPGVKYPDYYLVPFHSYKDGNLSWQAAFEMEPATYTIALRTFKDETHLTPRQAYEKMRGAITDRMKEYMTKHNVKSPKVIVDMGCSTGFSTEWLAEQFPEATSITGIDLSPHFLAVAEQAERRRVAAGKPRRIKYVHGLAEDNKLPAGSVDMVTFNFVTHECPKRAIDAFIKEGRRLIAPGGVLCFVDNNPRSKTIQNLPPVLFTLMKSTEPHSDEYYSYDMEAAMREAGFKEVIQMESDHRHRVVMGINP